MANNLYDTGAPQRVIVVNQQQPETALTRAQRVAEEVTARMLRNLAEYYEQELAGLRGRGGRRPPPEATRAPSGPILDAKFEVVHEAPPRRQLAAPKPTRRKK